MIETQRQQALLEQRLQAANRAISKYGVTIVHEHLYVTVLIEHNNWRDTPLDLYNIKQLISDYLQRGITEGADFDQVINEIFDVVDEHWPRRNIEINIYDNVEHFNVMRIFKNN